MPFANCGVKNCPSCMNYGITVDNSPSFEPQFQWNKHLNFKKKEKSKTNNYI